MLVVQKYGGSSLATPKHIRAAAERIAQLKSTGASVVVVASAMGHMTDHLLKLASKTVKVPPPREVDMLLTAGERISMSLLSMALQELGVPAISFTGSQSGILTTDAHMNAEIIDIRPGRICEELAVGKVVIIAGFQGVSEKKEITTLGRGGSDTTAVALAAILKADRCEILTDVDGIYDADPRIVPQAKILTSIDYDSALEMASLGAKMQARSIELAKKFNVNLTVTSHRASVESGTRIGSTKNSLEVERGSREKNDILGVATQDGFHLIQVKLSLSAFGEWLEHHSVPLRFLTQSADEVSFLCEKGQLSLVKKNLEIKNIAYEEIKNIAVVSVVGNGLTLLKTVFESAVKFMSQQNIVCWLFFSNSFSLSFAVESSSKGILANFLHQKKRPN